MLGTETYLALFYLGFGFVIFLGWAAIADELNKSLEPSSRARLRRLAVALAVGGVVHPALALAGRDIAGQLGRTDGPRDPLAERTIRIANWGVVAALGITALVISSHLKQFEDLPVLREVRTGSPFA